MEHVSGRIDIEYQWPLGEAERAFFDGLRERGEITGAECQDCGRIMVPPRSFCDQCFTDAVEYVGVPSTGVIESFSESYFSLHGKPLDEPFYVGIVRLDDTDGGLYHRLEPGSAEVSIGSRVEAVLRDEREGSILDIEHFRIL